MGIFDITLGGEGGAVYGVEGFACAGLFPIDDDEMLFQPTQGKSFGRQLAAAGAARQKKQHRFGGVFSADRYPLPTAV